VGTSIKNKALTMFDEICTFSNLLKAHKKAAKGKKSKKSIFKFTMNLENELVQLQQALQNQSYLPSKHFTFFITDPKPRQISAAPFTDRVVHHAICNIIEPYFEQQFCTNSFANRKSKGTHKAIDLCQYYMKNYTHVLKTDIQKYFPSIHRAILTAIIQRTITCSKTLSLISKIIDSETPLEKFPNYFLGDDLFSPNENAVGLPIGNLTSQLFANIYLNEIDQFLKLNFPSFPFIRYMDDVVIFGNNKEQLVELLKSLKLEASKLRLMLHSNKTFILPCSKELSFLGQKVLAGNKRLKGSNVRRFRKRISKKWAHVQKNKISHENFNQSLAGWMGHAKQANTFGLRKKIYYELKEKGWQPILEAGFCEAAHLATIRTIADQPIETTTNLTIETTISVFV
jgi:retron-type reverse transcriptase